MLPDEGISVGETDIGHLSPSDDLNNFNLEDFVNAYYFSGLDFVRSEMFIRKLSELNERQIGILMLIFEDELWLIDKGFVFQAQLGIIAKLENILKYKLEENKDKIKLRNELEYMGLGEVKEQLYLFKLIDEDTLRKIKTFIKLRNKLIHSNGELISVSLTRWDMMDGKENEKAHSEYYSTLITILVLSLEIIDELKIIKKFYTEKNKGGIKEFLKLYFNLAAMKKELAKKIDTNENIYPKKIRLKLHWLNSTPNINETINQKERE